MKAEAAKIAESLGLLREAWGWHRLIADAMKYVDYNTYGLDRLETERRAEQRRNASGVSAPDD